MSQSKFAVFVDLENVGANESMLQYIIDKVKIRGDILQGKVYGYTDRYDHLKRCLLSNTFSVVPSLRHGKNQKNNLDIQLVIDALEVAFVSPLIDSFCIVSGDSDYTPLVGKLKGMGKHVLGISRSEAASDIFIAACNEFIFLENVATAKANVKQKNRDRSASDGDIASVTGQIEAILQDNSEREMYASEIKDTLMRLRPDFSERNYGAATFGKFMGKVAEQSGRIQLRTVDSSLMVNLIQPESGSKHIDKANYAECFRQALETFRQEGFERINPSILKAAIQEQYPDFTEKQVGFRRFSDIMKALEKEGMLTVEMDDQHNMLLKIIGKGE